MNDFAPSLPLLRAFATCHQLFAKLANDLRGRPLVPGVLHKTDLAPVAGGFRLCEHLNPERLDGRWTYWQLQVTVTSAGHVTVKAESLLRVDAAGKAIVDVIATGPLRPTAEAPARLVEIARRLCAAVAT